MNWEACMFCQNADDMSKMSSVTTQKMSQHILDSSRFDQLANIHLSGVIDLIASEGKYHGTCYEQFIRDTSKRKENSKTTDVVMLWLTDELRCAADQGLVLELAEVWRHYCELAETGHIIIPTSFFSRRSSFREKLEPPIIHFYEFMALHNQAVEDRQTLLIPTKYAHIPTSKLATLDLKSPLLQFQPKDDVFGDGLMLRSDIMAQPRYEGFNVNEDEAISCVPEMFTCSCVCCLEDRLSFMMSQLQMRTTFHRRMNVNSKI